MQSTIQLFRHLYNNLPPLFPAEAKEAMCQAIEAVQNDFEATVQDVETVMIAFGYDVWPWNQAYKECFEHAETKVGEHFLLPKLPTALQAKYFDFKRYGGTLRDLHSGSAAEFFTTEDRMELCPALVETQRELHGYVDREIVGVQQKVYLKKVQEFTLVLQKIKKQLDALNHLADSEDEHKTLAQEIRERVRLFEQGLCLLGPELQFDAVCQSVDFFHSRKQHLNRMKGIHVPMELDFYAV